MPIKVTLVCEYVDPASAIHCDRCNHMSIGSDETIEEVVEDMEWSVVNGEIRCPGDGAISH